MNFANVKEITIPEGDVRSIVIGGVTVWEKPNPLPYDAEVEYVESGATRSSWVDTGIYSDATTVFSVDAQFLSFNGTDPECFGSHSNRFAFGKTSATAPRFQFIVQTTTVIQFGARDTDRHTFRIDAPGATVSLDTTSIAFSRTITPSANPLWLFARSGAPAPCNARVYSCQISQSGTLARDLVPVRVGTAGYLYDRANPTGGPSGNGLYGSATSTPLIAGPDKNGG